METGIVDASLGSLLFYTHDHTIEGLFGSFPTKPGRPEQKPGTSNIMHLINKSSAFLLNYGMMWNGGRCHYRLMLRDWAVTKTFHN